MALGTITSLGVGSGLDLQNMLDKLKKIDETTIDLQKADKDKLKTQVSEFDTLNAKLVQMKSSALDLSLKSNFMERSVSLSDKDIADASVKSGSEVTSYSINIKRMASKSSWQSKGVEKQDTPMYAAPSTSITSATAAAVTTDTALAFTMGSGEDQKSIALNIQAGSSLEDIAKAINTDTQNISSSGTYVTATVKTGANGSYIRLAATENDGNTNKQILISQGPDFIAPDITFSYKTGATADSVYVSVPPDSSYQDVVSLVNDGKNNSGITAALIDDGEGDTPWHLTLTANSTGENHRIFLNGITMTEMQGADSASLNSSFTLNGYEYQRQSNDGISDVILGVTLNLKKIGETELNVSSSSDNIKEKITNLVDTYNDFIKEVKNKSNYSPDVNKKNGILANIYSVKSLGSNLANLLGSSVKTKDTGVTSLFDLGMEINKDGTISLDTKVLDSALASSLDDVKDLFIGDSDNGIKGLGDILNDKLRDMTSSSGVLSGEKTAAQEKIDRLTQDIEDATTRLNKKYEIQTKQFVRLDALIGTLNSQSQYLTGILDSFNKTTQNK